MVSKEGARINPEEIVGDKANCSVSIYAESLIDNISGTRLTDNDDFNDGELTNPDKERYNRWLIKRVFKK